MLIDLTHTIQNGLPPYPGDTETVLIQSKNIPRDHYTNHQLSINMHAGTHIDGPMHLTESPVFLNDYPLDKFVGQGWVMDVSGREAIDYDRQYEELPLTGKIVILYTGWGKSFGKPAYFTHYPVVTESFARFLARKKVKMVGLDMPSPDKYPFAVHRILFEHEVLIAENLANVDRLLDLDRFEIMALPLNIRADSSVARIIARAL